MRFIRTENELMEKSARIFVAGHRGLVGSTIFRALVDAGFENVLTRTHAELDLTDSGKTDAFFRQERPEYVFLAAARVGGILANNAYPADFIRDNLAIQSSVISASHQYGVKRLLFLGSSCIYPKHADQPIREEALLTGPLEPTNRAYALAKIAGVEMCWSYNRQYGTRFLGAMPTNLYGRNDNFDPNNSHVIPALIRKFCEAEIAGAPTVSIWGSGTPRREFLYSDDLAEACLFLMGLDDATFDQLLGTGLDHLEVFKPPLVNVGSGYDITISELAAHIAGIVGFQGEIVYDASKPDGTPRKLMDSSKLNALGWQPKVDLDTGLRRAVAMFETEVLQAGV
jgi:GDP-L-fucose synthase